MKFMIYLGAGIGGFVGAYVPVLFAHVDPLSMWSVIAGIIGTLLGTYLGYKAGQVIGE